MLRPETTVGERYVQRWIDPRLNELGGATASTQAETETVLRLVASKLRVLSVMTSVEVKNCATAVAIKSNGSLLARLPAAQRAGASLLLDDAVAACRKIPDGISPSNDNGVVAKLQGELRAAQARIADQQRRVQENKAELAAAVARAASEPTTGKTASERLQDAAGKLEGTLATIESVAGLADARALNVAQAETRFEALDKLLKALSSGTTDLDQLTADQKQAVLVVRFIPSLANEVRAWAQERERIRLAPLILAKENQRLVLAGYEGELGVLQRRAKLLSRMLSAAEAEHLALVNARKVLVGDPGKPKNDEMATDLLPADFHQLLDSGPPAHRWRLYV